MTSAWTEVLGSFQLECLMGGSKICYFWEKEDRWIWLYLAYLEGQPGNEASCRVLNHRWDFLSLGEGGVGIVGFTHFRHDHVRMTRKLRGAEWHLIWPVVGHFQGQVTKSALGFNSVTLGQLVNWRALYISHSYGLLQVIVLTVTIIRTCSYDLFMWNKIATSEPIANTAWYSQFLLADIVFQ